MHVAAVTEIPVRKVGKSSSIQALLRSLQTPIPRVRAGIGYRIMLLLTAVVMLMLPLIYLAMIGLVCYGLYLHVTHDIAVFDQHINVRGAVIIYAAPIFVGVMLLAFMIKPLVARSTDDQVPLNLRREDEPALFAFIDHLCRALGAPTPTRIDVDLDVNASAGFRRGWWSMLSRDMVLSFGLPLAAGMDVRQFAGVMAHELGHFSQSSGMRLNYVIRHVNFWFARIVYHRDQWDWKLKYACRRHGHYLVKITAYLLQWMIALTRGILWCLMHVGFVVSAMMSRQMEFDADRYECRVAGNKGFARNVERLRCLSLASRVARNDVGQAWRERRLCDDMVALIRSRDIEMPEDVKQKLMKGAMEKKSRWWHSHPSDAKRIASAARENAAGVITIDAPATILFKDFSELCRVATMLHYKKVIGPDFKPQRLIKVEKMVESNAERKETYNAAQRFFRNLLDADRPVFPGLPNDVPADPSAIAERLLELRSRLLEQETPARQAANDYDEARHKIILIQLVRDLRTAGFHRGIVKEPRLDAMSDGDLGVEENRMKLKCAEARNRLDPVLATALERLSLGLEMHRRVHAVAAPAPVLEEADDAGEYDLAESPATFSGDPMSQALAALARSSADIEELRRCGLSMKPMLERLRPADNPKPLVEALIWHSRRGHKELRSLYDDLGTAPYPYEHGAKSLSLRQYIVARLPTFKEVGDVAVTSNSACAVWRSLYLRLMSDLALRAEQVEADLGLPPLEEPAPMPSD